jgi:hypothetical protein
VSSGAQAVVKQVVPAAPDDVDLIRPELREKRALGGVEVADDVARAAVDTVIDKDALPETGAVPLRERVGELGSDRLGMRGNDNQAQRVASRRRRPVCPSCLAQHQRRDQHQQEQGNENVPATHGDLGERGCPSHTSDGVCAADGMTSNAFCVGGFCWGTNRNRNISSAPSTPNGAMK